MSLCCFLFNFFSAMCLCVWTIENRHFTLIKELHYTIEGFWFSVCGCSVDTSSTTNSVSETCVVAETEASRAGVTSGDNTGGGGVLAWGSILTCALAEQRSDFTAWYRRNSSLNGVSLCDLFPYLWSKFLARNFTLTTLLCRQELAILHPLLKARLWF